MKRKAVVRLLAGTLCTATMAGSILPDTAVAYAKENPVGTVETATQEETSDTDKKPEAETPENTADPVDGKQKEEDPTAINMEAKEEEASKNKKEDGKTGQTDSGEQEKQPVQESGGAANDFKVEKKTKKRSENSTDKKKTEKGNDSRTEQNEVKPPVEEVFDEGYAASCKTYNDILTNLSFAEDSTVQDTAKFFVDECKEDLKKLADPKRNLSAFLDGSYEAAIRAEEGEDGSQDTENVRPTELVTQYEESKPQLDEVIACLNTFVTTDHETPEEKEAALQAAYETLDAYLNASNACRPQVSLETQENVSVPLAAEKTVTENGVRAFGWKYDKSYTRISTNDVATIQAYAKKGGKYLIKLQPKADGGKNLYCGQRIDVSNHTELVIVSESTNISLCVKSTMSKDPNTYSDMFRVEKGSSLTLGDNEKNGKHGVILDGRGTAHMGRLVCVEVGGSLNIYPGTEIKNNADGTAIINEESGVFTVKSGTQPTISGKGKGISNSATFHYNGNGTVTGDTDNGIYNSSTGVLNVTGGVDVTGMQKPGISNAGTATISGMARVRSASKTALSNGKTGTCTISGQATFQYLGGAIGTVNNKSIYNEGRLINTSAATYLSSNNNSVLQNGTFEISSDASHSKNLCIYLYEQKFVTVTGTLNSVNYLQPKNRKAGRKVAQASYAGADGSTILNKLALTDDSKFCLRSGKTLNLQKANAALKGSGINASDLMAKDVILSEAVQVTYKSGLNADIACTMPKTQDTYWYEDVKVKASVNVNGKESMKPYIQDKAQRNIYQFLGWYDKDGVQRYDPVTDQWYDPETRKWSKEYTYSGAKDLVLTARWEKSYNIAYHGNGQTVGDDYTQEKDKSLIISDTEMYKFDGKFYKGLVGEDTFQRTETYKKDENGNLLDKNNKTVTDERRAAKLTSLNPDTGKEEPCEEQYSVKEWGTSKDVLSEDNGERTFELGKERITGEVYDIALQSTNDKGENLCITYDAPDDMVKKGREEKPADKLSLGVKKQDAAVYGASQGKMTSGTWLNIYAVWDKFPQLDAYNRYFTLKQAENGEITTEALLTTLRFKDEEDTDGRYLYSKDYEYNKKENCLIIKGKDGATLKLRAETDMESLKETGKSTIRYTLTDSAGNITTKEVECWIVDTSDIQKEYDTYVRFISPKYYKKNGAYVSKENGGLEENSIWKTDPEYAALLDKAMSNEKRGIQKKSVRVFGVKFEADDPGSGTWDHVEETWEFTHEQVRSVDDFVDEHGYMNYKEKDGLKKFREQYKDCIK